MLGERTYSWDDIGRALDLELAYLVEHAGLFCERTGSRAWQELKRRERRFDMDPDACVRLGTWELEHGDRDVAREFAEDYFTWITSGGFTARDRDAADMLLESFGYDPLPTTCF